MSEEPTRAVLEARIAKMRADIESLSPPERIRLAADLLEACEPKFALAILRSIVSDLEALKAAGAF